MLKIIENLCEYLSQQEIQAGFRKKTRSAPANEAFVKAVTWLVTDAIATKVTSSKRFISVSRNKNHYRKEKPDRTGLATWGLSYETAIRDPKTEAGALNGMWLFGYLNEVEKGRYYRDGKGPKGITTNYAATKKLLDLFDNRKQTQALFIPKPKREIIILKAHNENHNIKNEAALLDWEDTQATIKMRNNL